jgi:hypothetical protein
MEENLQKLYQTKQAVLDGESNLMDQIDDFDHNMMDEASINCPDGDYNVGHHNNNYHH